MPRRPRMDAPGRLHHVLNRGLDRRQTFRRHADYRFFLLLLALAVRAGRIRVHAYCLMPNHFHLLVESLDGNVSETMRWIQSRYAAHYNLVYQHTGHVFQGRFHSFPVLSRAYRFALVRYIHLNPVVAGLCADPLDYPYSSAAWHALESPRPRWLARSVVDEFLAPASGLGTTRETAFREIFALRAGPDRTRRLVKARMGSPSRDADALDRLCHAGADQWAEWLVELASEPGVTHTRLPMADARSILDALTGQRTRHPGLRLRTAQGRARDPWPVAAVGLLHDLGGLSHARAARVLRVSETLVGRRHGTHREAVRADPAYVSRLAEACREALQASLGPAFAAGATAAQAWPGGPSGAGSGSV